MIKNEPDTVTLSGDPLDRAQQVLDVARHQIRVAQHEADNLRAEDALTEAEEEVDAARVHVADAAEAAREAEEENGATERKRQAWRPGHGRFSGSYPMTIVTYRHQPKRKRPAKAVPAAITGPRIISAKGPGKSHKAPVEKVVDPESEARVAAFFKRMIRPL